MKRFVSLIALVPAALVGLFGGMTFNFYLLGGWPHVVTTTTQPVRQEVAVSTKKAKPQTIYGVPVPKLTDGVIVKPNIAISDQPTWTLNALGDIIIGRVVYQQIKAYGVNYPFAKMAAEVADADLTTADQESSISTAHTIECDRCMSFVSPDRVTDGLKYAGIDAVSLANNHSYNGGQAGFIDTMASLKKRGITFFGAGANYTEAHTAKVITVKGVKVGLLGYNSIVGGYSATQSTAGMAEISLAPWEPWNESEIKQMEADIAAAKKKADVVLVQYHWSAEYTHKASEQMRQVAHRALDAGATMIIGSHPHWVQGIEWYHGKLIMYSLANFVFDQEWSTETKQGMYLHAQFAGPKLIAAKLVPYQIDHYAQPHPVSIEVARQILADVFANSWWVKG